MREEVKSGKWWIDQILISWDGIAGVQIRAEANRPDDASDVGSSLVLHLTVPGGDKVLCILVPPALRREADISSIQPGPAQPGPSPDAPAATEATAAGAPSTDAVT